MNDRPVLNYDAPARRMPKIEPSAAEKLSYLFFVLALAVVGVLLASLGIAGSRTVMIVFGVPLNGIGIIAGTAACVGSFGRRGKTCLLLNLALVLLFALSFPIVEWATRAVPTRMGP